MLRCLLLALVLAATAKLHAQLPTSAPVLATPPNIVYPAIARAAHLAGDVVATFTIESDGTTSSIQLVSGHPMLQAAVLNSIAKWRFKTPLPIAADTHFQATYHFSLNETEDDDDDDLDGPPYTPSGGDVIILPTQPSVIGEVRSLTGDQKIDVSATSSSAPTDRCPKDKQKSPPTTTDLSDFIELRRSSCAVSCPDYRVRISRNGQVTWFGRDGVATLGERDSLLNTSVSEALLEKFQTPAFWSACSVEIPPQQEPKVIPKLRRDDEEESEAEQAEEDSYGVFITARINGITKSVNAMQYSFASSDIAERFVWAIDKAADTHRWRHGDPASEPFTKMREDLLYPKPGITALMRSTYHFNPATGQQTYTRLENLLKRGIDMDAADVSGWTALMYAAFLEGYERYPIEKLLEARANPNLASLHGDTALMMSAYNGYLSQPLLAHGANINARNADGVTTLMFLVQRFEPGAVKDALTAGADPNAHDNAGRTALDYVRTASCAKPTVPFGWTPPPIPAKPWPCPNTTNPNFNAVEALLLKAMHPTNP